MSGRCLRPSRKGRQEEKGRETEDIRPLLLLPSSLLSPLNLSSVFLTSLLFAVLPGSQTRSHRRRSIISLLLLFQSPSPSLITSALPPFRLFIPGVYSYLCTPSERKITPPPYVCEAQDLRLNTVFSYATVATNVAALPIGVCLDRAGPKKTSLLGAMFFAAGCASMALDVTGGGELSSAWWRREGE